jgi:crotonobetainyl-CoA hydratase
VQRGLDEANLERAMAQQLDSVAAMYRSTDFVEGPKAFAEKRKPNWSGK